MFLETRMQETQSRGRAGQPYQLWQVAVLLSSALLASVQPLAAQAALPVLGIVPNKLPLCRPEQFWTSKQLTFWERACWHGSELLSPWGAVAAGFSSGLGQWHNYPYVRNQDSDDYVHRFAVYYVKRSARETGELIAGYFNHEDPRPHTSGQTLFRKRLGVALLSVLVTRDDLSASHVALAPIAGSLGSAFAGAAFYRQHTGVGYAFRGAGISYGSYFGRAVYREFRPDILLAIDRMLHRRRN
jgi:hypothetical protein